jgi:alkylation response protein AidB-like acyl-CoA dehydrogenase
MREEPLIQQVIGQISAKVYAAEQIVLGAARELDHVTSTPALADSAEGWSRVELASQKAHIIVPGLIVDAAGQLFDALGASATSRSKKLDRHWRNARTVATHNPAVYKARIVGDYEINGTAPVGLTAIGVVSAKS